MKAYPTFMATIKDIAREADVSFKTVARVLNGEANVRSETRDRVLKAAKNLNYQANTAARNLRTKRPRTVVLLINNPSQSYSQSVQLGALMGCQKHGLFLNLQSNSDPKFLKTLAETHHIMGFILAPPLSDNLVVLETLKALDLPFVRLGTEHPNAIGTRLSIDDSKASLEMTNYLLSLGHNRIGFIKGPVDYDVSAERLEGYMSALTENEITIEKDLIVQGDFSYTSGLEAAETLLSLPLPPTAIFASNDEMAAGCLAAAYKKDLRVPDALSIAGFDDSPIAMAVYPQVTTIRQPLSDMVETAVELLVKPASEASVPKLVLGHTLIARDSTGPAL